VIVIYVSLVHFIYQPNLISERGTKILYWCFHIVIYYF